MKAIRLQDFRCYTSQEFAFKSGINLLVGDNASGKTSVLKACQYVLGAFFAGFSDENTKWLTISEDDFRQSFYHDMLLPEQPIMLWFNISDVLADSHPTMFDGRDGFCPFFLTKTSKKNSRSPIKNFKEYRNATAELQKTYISEQGQSWPLPLFAAFSTEDIHSRRKIDASSFKNYTPKPSFGYYECLNGDGFFPYWIKRLLVLQEGGKGVQEIAIVGKAISDALGAEGCNIIESMHVRPKMGKVYYQFVDGREIEAASLSDGYRRLVSMVTDIAFRCALLNRGIYGEQACEFTNGTVLIDEVDLHLHPSLQSVVLKGFRRAFPRLQFIVSSHAPMVMSGVQNNEMDQVLKLDYSKEAGYTVANVDTYGMDLSTLTNVVLDQTPRAVEVDLQLQQLFTLIDEEHFDRAQTMLKQMREKFGDSLPELSEAQAMLHCLED